MLPQNYKSKIENNLIKLWQVWRTLGLFSEGSSIAMSPEEAIIGLCILGRFDQRLFDEAVSFIILHSRFLSKNRIQFLLKKIDKDSKRVFHLIASILKIKGGDGRFVSIIKGEKQSDNQGFFINFNNSIPFTGKREDKLFLGFGFRRNLFEVSEKIRNLKHISQINPWMKAKLLYGNTVRADTVLEITNKENCTAPAIASRTGYSQKSVWHVLNDFEQAGFIHGKKSLNRIVYNLSDSGNKQFSQFKIKKTMEISDWIKIGHYVSALKKLPEDSSELLIQSEENCIERLFADLKI